MTALLVLTALTLTCAGLVMAIIAHKVNGFEKKILCALRLTRKRSRGKPIRAWENVATRLTGLLCLAIGLAILAHADFNIGFFRCESQAGFVSSSSVDGAAEESADLRSAITNAVHPLMSSGKHIGMAVGAISGGKTLALGFGGKELGGNEPPDGNTLFEIGSVTKVFTAAALCIMAEGGEVDLGDPVASFLPPVVRVPAYEGSEISLLDLATHTSGLPRLPGLMLSARRVVTLECFTNPYASYTDEEMYGFLSGHRLGRAPGEEYLYSNLGMGLLGLALSLKRGTSYEELVWSLVCEPLEMKDTAITLSDEQRLRLAQGYAVALPGVNSRAKNWTFKDCFAGAGALRSTANDMLKFLAANLACVDSPLVPILEKTHAVRHRIDDELSVGMGWHILEADGADGPVMWHDGGTGGYKSFIAFCKASNSGVVVLSNSTGDVWEVGLQILRSLSK